MDKVKAKRETIWTSKLVVLGSGAFPFDMLRFDTCVPARGEDVTAIASKDLGMRVVRLERFARYINSGPTVDRWESFGWHVFATDEAAMNYMERRQKEATALAQQAMAGLPKDVTP